ncbi:MAG TPA: oligosaccharide flippase family protein [Phenylobacterium sp.]|nr:oligosaccharide flippase family protein [Phenylobacterium sp.]
MLSFVRKFSQGHLRGALIGSVVSLASKLATAGLGFGVTILIARRFGAAGSGTWVLASTLLAIVGYVCTCGLDYSTTRAIAVYRAAGRWSAARAWGWTSLGIILALGVPVSLGVWAALEPLARALKEGPEFVALMGVLCLSIITSALSRLVGGLLRGLSRFALAEILESALVPVALGVCAFTVGLHSLVQVAWIYSAATLVSVLCGLAIWFVVLGDKGRPADPLMPREAMTRSLPLAGTVLATLATPWIMTLFLARFADAADVGIFRVGVQFSLLLSFLLTAVETGMSPQIAALHSQGKLHDLLGATKQMTLLLVVLGGVPSMILIVFAPQLLSLLGPEFPAGATAMRILLAGQVLKLLSGPVGSYMVMTGLGRMSLWNAVNSAIVVLVLCALLIPLMGIEGAAIAGAMSTVVRYFTATVVLWRVHGIFLPLGLAKAGSSVRESA